MRISIFQARDANLSPFSKICCFEFKMGHLYDLCISGEFFFFFISSADLILRVNPISLSYPFPLPLPLSFARSRESEGYPNSRFDRGVGLRGSGRYPLKPSIFASLLETKGYPEHTAQPATMAARSSRESHKCIFGLNN